MISYSTVMKLLLLIWPLISIPIHGQITIKINERPPLQITAAQLESLPHHETILHDHGKDIQFEGPSLADTLKLAQFDFGRGLHGKALSQYVLAKASDGYQVIFALAEFDETLSLGHIVIANRREGRPISPAEGPLRLIVPHDKRPARSVRQLVELSVKQLP